jgi:hypothetical protein
MNPTQILAAIAAQAAQGVQTNTPADGYVQVIGKLMEHASQWSAISSSGLKCNIVVITPQEQHVSCVSPAIGVCVACNGPVCFSHALISPSSGDMVCYGCVAKLTGQSPNPRQEQPKRKKRRQQEDSGLQCTCTVPWRLDPECPVHGRQSSDETARIRRKHLRILDLDEESDWEDIQFAYKKLVKEHHPDRHPPSRRKQKEARMRKINAAYAWLKKQYEEAA